MPQPKPLVSDLDELAEELHTAWAAYRLRKFSVVSPRWFALRDELKEHWRDVAQQTLCRGPVASVRGEDPDA